MKVRQLQHVQDSSRDILENLTLRILAKSGPGLPGGVSGGLNELYQQLGERGRYTHLVQEIISGKEERFSLITLPTLARQVLEAKRVRKAEQFWNAWIWPAVHGQFEYCPIYDEDDESAYMSLGGEIAHFVADQNKSERQQDAQSMNGHAPDVLDMALINDYQVAVAPLQLLLKGIRSIMFWHVPWPSVKRIPLWAVIPMSKVLQGMLGAEVVGMHTEGYCQNALEFLDTYCKEYTVDKKTLTVQHKLSGRRTQFVVAPLPINFDYWSEIAQAGEPVAPYFDDDLSQESVPANWLQPIADDHPMAVYWRGRGKKVTRVIRLPHKLKAGAKVARADITKNILQTMDGIDKALQKDPSLIGNVVFPFFIQETRLNVKAYADLWVLIKAKYDQLQAKYGRPDWQPILWVKPTVPQNQLAPMFARADFLLVTPIADGLNLTAKEYLAAREDGVIVLSTEAGVYQELGDDVVIPVNPNDVDQIAAAIITAFHMTVADRIRRSSIGRAIVKVGSFADWLRKLVRGIPTGNGNGKPQVTLRKATANWPLLVEGDVSYPSVRRLSTTCPTA